MSALQYNTTADNTLDQGLLSHLGRLPLSWRPALNNPEARSAIQTVTDYLDRQLAERATIFPRYPFRALESLTPESVKVVILGQDPYHGANQAQGLAFSVPDSCPRPPSLRNILAELQDNYPDLPMSGSHDLTPWTSRGVLLLNAVLTVESGKPASHANQGWEAVTDAFLQHVARLPTPKVYMLWGAYAQRKRALLESPGRAPRLILTANHPSPLSARRPPQPFMGCRHFLEANTWLENNGVSPIDWSL